MKHCALYADSMPIPRQSGGIVDIGNIVARIAEQKAAYSMRTWASLTTLRHRAMSEAILSASWAELLDNGSAPSRCPSPLAR